jgi:hypothetical protein
MANKIHQMGRIFAVVNCEGSVQADSVGIFAEEARMNRVKCSCSHDRVSDCRRAPAHNIRNNAIDDEMSHAMGKRVGLARACTRNDQKRSCLG